MNWVANFEMKQLLDSISNHMELEELQLNTFQLNRLFNQPFKKVKDCIIISEKSIRTLEKSFDTALNIYMDRTGYEASNTETRINDYFKSKISMQVGTQIALLVIKIWSLQLKKLEPDSKFCFIMSSDDEKVEIRFHKVRECEPGWLNDDIESYTDGAIGYICFYSIMLFLKFVYFDSVKSN